MIYIMQITLPNGKLSFDGVLPLSARNHLSAKHTFPDPPELLPLSKRLIKV